MAGGPVSVADQYNTIGNNLHFYQNTEMLALNADGFVGKPLTSDPTNVSSQIWKGQMSNGDWIVGLFNRENTAQTRSINFSSVPGISGNATVRDLWLHSDLGSMSSYSASVPAHGCIILKIVPDGGGAGGIVSGGIYKIINKNSGKALDVYQQSLSNGAIIHQWDDVGASSQKWKAVSAGNGTFTLTNMNSNKNMDVFQQSTADGAAIHQWSPATVNSQKWTLVSVGSGYYKIVNYNSGKALDVYGASTANGAQVKQYTYTGGSNQQWTVTKIQ